MARKLDLQHRPGFRDYLIDAYLTSGLTMRAIGAEIGVSAATILNHMRRLGIESRPTAEYNRGRKLTPEHIEIIRRTHTGKTVSQETRKRLSETRKSKHFRSPNWHGGRRTGRIDRYAQIYAPDHPGASKEGYVKEHRLVMEQIIGRYLTNDEVVHHINRNKCDNRPENLRLMTNAQHASYHSKERWRKRREQNLSCR